MLISDLVVKVRASFTNKRRRGQCYRCKRLIVKHFITIIEFDNGKYWTNWRHIERFRFDGDRSYCPHDTESFIKALHGIRFISKQDRDELILDVKSRFVADRRREDQSTLNRLAKKYGFEPITLPQAAG